MPVKTRRILILLGSLVVIFGCWSLITTQRDSAAVTRQVAFTFSVHNNSNELIENLHLVVSSPMRESGSQVVQEISWSVPGDSTSDLFGNTVESVKLTLPPYGSKSISMNGAVALKLQPTTIKIDKQHYVGDLPALSLNSPEIQGLTRQLKSTTTRELAQEIYSLVRGTIAQGNYDAEDRGALEAIKAQKGDCTEFASLTVALLRAKNIPARRVAGYVVKSNQVLDSAALHNWAEFYEDGTWHILDPYLEVIDKGYGEYLTFQVEAPSSEGALAFGERLRVSDSRVTVKLN